MDPFRACGLSTGPSVLGLSIIGAQRALNGKSLIKRPNRTEGACSLLRPAPQLQPQHPDKMTRMIGQKRNSMPHCAHSNPQVLRRHLWRHSPPSTLHCISEVKSQNHGRRLSFLEHRRTEGTFCLNSRSEITDAVYTGATQDQAGRDPLGRPRPTTLDAYSSDCSLLLQFRTRSQT